MALTRQVEGLVHDAGKLVAARVRDSETGAVTWRFDNAVMLAGESFVVRARSVVNATGPFTGMLQLLIECHLSIDAADAILKMDSATAADIVVPSIGTHIILPGSIPRDNRPTSPSAALYCPSDMGLLNPKTSDGRVIFCLPWEGHTLVGTTGPAARCTLMHVLMALQTRQRQSRPHRRPLQAILTFSLPSCARC